MIWRLTVRQEAQRASLDAEGCRCYQRNRRVGASHAEALRIARDDMEMRAYLAKRAA